MQVATWWLRRYRCRVKYCRDTCRDACKDDYIPAGRTVGTTVATTARMTARMTVSLQCDVYRDLRRLQICGVWGHCDACRPANAKLACQVASRHAGECTVLLCTLWCTACAVVNCIVKRAVRQQAQGLSARVYSSGLSGVRVEVADQKAIPTRPLRAAKPTSAVL